ncbi:MAG: hypothetical protein WCX65_01725 [bacterium]
MKKTALLTVFLLIAPFAAASASVSSMTIEFKNGAVFVQADAKIMKEIKEWAEKSGIHSAADSKNIIETLSGRYGNRIQIESFVTQQLSAAAGVKEVRMPLRNAILAGRIPPVENLSLDEAMIVLGGFGFTAMTDRYFSSLSNDMKLRKLVETDTALIILDGTGPDDELKMYYREETGEKH